MNAKTENSSFPPFFLQQKGTFSFSLPLIAKNYILMASTATLEQLYSTFRVYSPSNMHYCTCGCIDPRDVQALAKPLHQLTAEILSTYQASALYTWGAIEHYKYHLPRILELWQAQQGKGWIELEDIIQKLDYAAWRTWPAQEMQVIKSFVLEAWVHFVNGAGAKLELQDIVDYSFFLELKDLLAAWEISPASKGIANFVYFFYYNGNAILQQGFFLKKKDYSNTFQAFIQQEILLANLEEEYYQQEATAYAEQVAVVAQLLEQEQQNH